MPTVSVIVPVFNRQDVLPRALDSVLAQTYDDYELIVVDDGSATLVNVTIQQPGIRVVRHETNLGAAAARNTGVGAARGRYVAFLDSDDTWHPEKLARQVAFMEADASCRALCTGFALSNDGKAFDSRLPPPVSNLNEILWGCRVSPGTTLMVERTLFEETGPMDETLGRLEDWDWMLRAAEHAPFMGLRQVLADVHHDRYAHVDEAKFVAAAEKIASYTRGGRYRLSRAQKMILLSAVQYELAATYYRKRRFGVGLSALAKSFLYCPWKRPGHALAALNTVRADIRRVLLDGRGKA